MKGRYKVFLVVISILLFLALVTIIILGEIKFNKEYTYGNSKTDNIIVRFYSISS